MEFNRIKIIEHPRKLFTELSSYDMGVLQGGLNPLEFLGSDYSCGIYTHCSGNKTTSCTNYSSNGTCCDGNNYCGTYKSK